MERLFKKLSEIGQDLKSLINPDQVLDENERLLDKQDLVFLLKVSFRTLQRYRLKDKLPYFTIGHKTYYRASNIQTFVREYADSQTCNQFKNQSISKSALIAKSNKERSLYLGYSSVLPPRF